MAIKKLPGPSHAPFINCHFHLCFVTYSEQMSRLKQGLWKPSDTLCVYTMNDHLSHLHSVCECMPCLALYYADLFFCS